ncbi:MAG: SpoIID/LytB domain-containing protein [Bacteroides sp.]|nr:SpoIID/LytB domain-containing protein [Bacteroidales bacterium]MBD5379342.1 SpoIID/LytB domain-containing protein [Bacteroides sp.]MDE5809694.1 SpoIID/LytB domain-containing protein [Muribaculaceae bacterium]
MNQPVVKVGIMSTEQLQFVLLGTFRVNGAKVEGDQTATVKDGKIYWNGELFDRLSFIPDDDNENSRFTLKDVTIGVNFHWERLEDQTFVGQLDLIVENNKITPINVLGVEDYLKSVISSEMSATASLELLKAHAVISRSWLLSQIEKNKEITNSGQKYSACTITDDEIVRWYDREDHVNFDVCADDHCQRYQGVTRQTTPNVDQAVEATRGEVLWGDGKICDARFSKCCGGVYEVFENCWEPIHYSYLVPRRDGAAENDYPDLTIEENARQWILGQPEAFCNTHDKKILSQVLNNYDQETTDFYRWKVEYDSNELSALIKERSGLDFGELIDIIPLSRGTSGRIYRLKIVGSKMTKIIGKELEIRRTLSKSHLYSSAFVVEKQQNGDSTRFILHGAGWGHGVGLCQIGAAVMGDLNYTYRSILLHYFIGAEIKKYY